MLFVIDFPTFKQPGFCTEKLQIVMCLNILLILFHVNIVLKRGFDSMFRGVCVLLFTVTLSCLTFFMSIYFY